MIVAAQVRQAIAARVETVSGLAGHIVIDAEEIPEEEITRHWCVITTGNSAIEQVGMGHPTLGQKQIHTEDISVALYYPDRKEPAQQAETLLELVVPALFADLTLGGLVKRFSAIGTSRAKNTIGAPIAELRLQCQTVYQTYDRDPTQSV